MESKKNGKNNLCRNCRHWYNRQRDLNYLADIGFCLNPLFAFNTESGRAVGVIDTQNKKPLSVTGECSHDIETRNGIGGIKESRYLLQTHDDFGCIFFDAE